MKPHDHLCLIYATREEQFAAVIPFLRLGLERHERCVYIVDENTADAVLRALKDDGVDAAAAVKSGALAVITKRDAYLKNGYFDPDLMIRFLEDAVESAESKGYSALRVTGEMTWALGSETGVERLIEYEAKLNDVFPRHRVTAICQYNRTRFSPAVIKQVIFTHPYVISGGLVAKNPFFIPTSEYLSPGQPAIEVERLLANIVDFQRAQDELRAEADARGRLAAIVEFADDAIIAKTLDGKIAAWNAGARKLYGYEAEEVLGKSFSMFVPPEEAQEVSWILEKSRRGENITQHETLRVRKDGRRIRISLTVSPILDDSGAIVGASAVARDITERKRAEEALKLSEENLKRAQAVAHVGSWFLDVPKNELLWSDETYRMFRIPIGTPMTYEKFLENVHPDDCAAVNAAWTAALAHKPYDIEHRALVDGKIRWVREIAEVEFGADGRALRGIGTVQDITDRTRIEEELRRSERELRKAQQISRLGSWSWVVESDTIFWSDEYHRMVGHDPRTPTPGYQEHLKMYAAESSARLDAAVQDAMKNGTPYELDLDLLVPGGGRKAVVARGESIRDTSGKVLMLRGTLQDITERKRAEETLRRTSRALRTLGLCNEAMIRASDENDLLSKVCAAIVEGGRFMMSWVGFRVDDEKRTVRPMAQAGRADGYLQGIDVTWGEGESGSGPTGTAVRTRSAAICRDIRTDPLMAPWRARALERGYLASIALPLTSGDDVLGALMIYSGEADAFGREEVDLLSQLADDLSFGIVALRTRETLVRSEETLRRSNAYHRGLIEVSLDPLVTIDVDGKITDVNRATEIATGCARERLIGSDFSGYFTEPERARIGYKTAFDQGSVKDYALNIRRSDGGVMPVLYNAAVYRDAAGLALGVFAAARDISDLNRAEDELRNSLALTEAAMESTADGILVVDRDERFTNYNEKFVKMWDIPDDMMASRNDRLALEYVMSKLKDPKAFRVRVEELYSRPDVSSLDIVELTDGRILERYSIPQRISGEIVGRVWSFRDVTETRRAEAEIRKLNAELEERVMLRTAQVEAVNMDLEAFTYSVSHDLRAPLRTVDAFSQILIEDYAPKLEPECQRYLRLVRHGAQVMGKLIDDLLAFSRLGRLPMTKSFVSMDEVLKAALAAVEEQRQGRNVSFKVGGLASCQGDFALLKQVWINLLSNALKFTGKREEALIEIDSREEAGETVYRIKDNGVGFDMRFVDKLFKVFQRLHPREEYDGTGVGLAIVARVIERHGGRVWATAELDKGAEFFFTLGGRML